MPLRFVDLTVSDVEMMEAELRTLCARAGAEAVVLLDMSGVVLASHRVPEKIDGLLFAALLTSNFAATEELSRRLGVDNFRVMYHEGKRQNLYFDKVSDDAIIVVLFRDSNALGRVRLFSDKAIPELARQVAAVTKSDTPILPQGKAAAEYLRQIAKGIARGDSPGGAG
jgi:predicted regulator of Ras-like GTPase activity (Roadblock/LC7/MglB family)